MPIPVLWSLQATRPVASISAVVTRQAELDVHRRARRQRAHRTNREAALADVERERRRDRLPGAVGDRHAQRHARAGSPVEAVRKQVRRQGRQNLRRGGVLVDVARDVQRQQRAHLVGRVHRAREDDDRQGPARRRAQCAHERHAVVGQPQVDECEADGRVDARRRRARRRLVVGRRRTRGGRRPAPPRIGPAPSRCRWAIRIVLSAALRLFEAPRYNRFAPPNMCGSAGSPAPVWRGRLLKESVWRPVPNATPKLKSTKTTWKNWRSAIRGIATRAAAVCACSVSIRSTSRATMTTTKRWRRSRARRLRPRTSTTTADDVDDEDDTEDWDE